MPEALPARARAAVLVAAAACLLPLLLTLPPGLAAFLAALGLLAGLVQRPWPALLRLLLAGLMTGLVLATHGFSMGRDTGSALLATMLVLKAFELRRPRDLRSLLGFALFAPFSAFLLDQGPLSMVLAVPAVALLMLALSVLADPGDAPRGPGAAPRLRQVGVAVVLALPLALAGFWLFPRLPTPLWGMPETALGRGGLDDRMRPDQWIELFADDAPALRVRFLGDRPLDQNLYWRARVLWQFDGATWSGRYDRGQSLAVPGDAARLVDYEVELEPTDERYLVALDVPLQPPDGYALSGDRTISGELPVTNPLRYRLRSSTDMRYLEGLDPVERRLALAMPPGLNPRTRALAEQWRREEGGDPLRIAARALSLVRSDLSYSLSVPPSGRHAVDDLLFESRVGFCQHFSSAFAFAMRAAGVPARVVIGYVGGSRNRFGDYWVVRRMDAHAWNEIWVDGRGWVRIDPTAAVAPERVRDTVQDLAREQAVLPEAFAPLRDFGDWMRRSWNDLVLGFDAGRQLKLLRPLGIDQATGWQLVLAFGVGAGLALALTLFVMLRGEPGRRPPLERAWRAFLQRMARAGLAKADAEPALAYGRRAAAALPAHAASLQAFAEAYARWRYAPGGLDAGEREALAAALRRFRPGAPREDRG